MFFHKFDETPLEICAWLWYTYHNSQSQRSFYLYRRLCTYVLSGELREMA